ncbi:MAG: T9SS type A sorting domain-containing protein [Flavobacteriales bacterium]|nr:T9SS type A sorting domain-containing protein [Flavobacteriales bacterium]MCC6939625.1 T9SS type A sorting domain-containing protein [Flavobacteriales bacterium]
MKHLSTLILSSLTLGASAQLTITDSLSVGSLAQLLEGLNVSIANVEVNCAGSAMGHFSGSSELAITEGLLLTTGGADLVAGPVGDFASGYSGTPGDPDLNLLVGVVTNDACVLEFDCVPLGDTLLFNFSFGSEEYPEFVNSGFNDVFAIYLSGPGFPMPTNVAALPDGTPVAIDNVNAGINNSYFHDNQAGNGTMVTYDGFTTNLTAFAVVSPEETYHFKVAIADVADAAFDSGVFLEAFSFRSVMLTTGIAANNSPIRLVRQGDQLIATLPAVASKGELAILDAAGRIVQRTRISSDRTVIDLASLTNGLYILQALGADGIAPVRFVKD